MSLLNHFAISLSSPVSLLVETSYRRQRALPTWLWVWPGRQHSLRIAPECKALRHYRTSKVCDADFCENLAAILLFLTSILNLQSRRCRPAVLLRHCRLLDDVVWQPVGWQASPLSQLRCLALERSKQDTHHVSLLGWHPTLLSMLHVAGRTEQRLSKLPVRKKKLTGLRWIPASRRGWVPLYFVIYCFSLINSHFICSDCLRWPPRLHIWRTGIHFQRQRRVCHGSSRLSKVCHTDERLSAGARIWPFIMQGEIGRPSAVRAGWSESLWSGESHTADLNCSQRQCLCHCRS